MAAAFKCDWTRNAGGPCMYPGVPGAWCPNRIGMVLEANGPLLGLLHMYTEGSGGDSQAGPLVGPTIPLQNSASTHLRLPHMSWDGMPPGMSERWPVLFLQNPYDEPASGCIRLELHNPQISSYNWNYPFAVPPHGTLAWEVGNVLLPPPPGELRFSAEVRTVECEEGGHGSIVGAAYTFRGADWDAGIGMSQPALIEVLQQLGETTLGAEVGAPSLQKPILDDRSEMERRLSR